MKQKQKLSLMLVLMMVLSFFPVGVFATDEGMGNLGSVESYVIATDAAITLESKEAEFTKERNQLQESYDNIIGEKLIYTEYTKETWNQLSYLLSDTDSLLWYSSKGISSGYTAADFIKMRLDLIQARADLVKVAKQELVEITTAEELSEADGTDLYVLLNDIVGYEGNSNTLTGTLNGYGHTITFAKNAKPLFQTIAKDAEVKNVGLTGTVSGGGAFAEIFAGKIFNSYSWADVDGGESPAGGIAGKVEKGNTVEVNNTYVLSHVTGSASNGAMIGELEKGVGYINLGHSYWVNSEKTIGIEHGKEKEDNYYDEQKTLDEIKKIDFTLNLNSKRGLDGIQWNRNSESLPYFGEEAAPEVFYPVVMTDLLDDTNQTTITGLGESLTTDIFGLADGYVAELGLDGYDGNIRWKTEYHDTDNSPVIVAATSGRVFVREPGTVTVKALEADTGDEIQTFTITAKVPEQFDLSFK